MKLSLLLMLFLTSTVWAKWSVTTYNIRNFDRDMREGRTDLEELARIIKTTKSDVMAFEEIVNVQAFKKMVAQNLPGYAYQITTCGGGGKQKLALAYNQATFDFVGRIEDRTFSGGEGSNGCGSLRPVLLVDLRRKETNTLYTFGVVHLKAGGDRRSFERRWKQYGGLKHLSDRYTNKNLILLGDFNTTGYNLKDDDYVRFENFIGQAKMRTMSETLGCTSYWKGILGGEELQPSILDHIVIQDKNLSEVSEVTLGAHCAKVSCRPALRSELGISFESVSDHCPIQVTFN